MRGLKDTGLTELKMREVRALWNNSPQNSTAGTAGRIVKGPSNLWASRFRGKQPHHNYPVLLLHLYRLKHSINMPPVCVTIQFLYTNNTHRHQRIKHMSRGELSWLITNANSWISFILQLCSLLLDYVSSTRVPMVQRVIRMPGMDAEYPNIMHATHCPVKSNAFSSYLSHPSCHCHITHSHWKYK